MLRLDANGHLGQDATSFTTKDGVIYYTFNIAVKRGREGSPTWIKCFKKENDLNRLRLLTKGTHVLVTGVPSAETYFNNNTNTHIATLKLEVYSLDILSSTQRNSVEESDDLPDGSAF